MAFGYLTTKRLVVADNIFMNAANGVAAPLVRPMDAESEVLIRNDMFLNNVFTWQVNGSANKYTLKRYAFEGNSFILNFPYNPDATTSNPGTLEIGNKYAAAQIDIKGNLFAFNVGGVIFPQWDDKAGPKLAITDNLFWQNGALFEGKGPGKGAIVGKFNRGAVHLSYTPDEAADDFSWTLKGNVVEEPGLTVPVLDMRAVSYGGDKKKAEAKSDEAEEDNFFGTPKTDITFDEDIEAGDYAVDGKIKNFAPHMPFNVEAFPVARSGKAKQYGVDFVCTDGTTLRDSGATDFNGVSLHANSGHGGAIPLNTWTQLRGNVGQWLNGKTIDRILVSYDRPSSTGDYRGYIDDIVFTNGALP